MYKKVAVIIILALLLGLILYLKPFRRPVKAEIKIIRTLPSTESGSTETSKNIDPLFNDVVDDLLLDFEDED